MGNSVIVEGHRTLMGAVMQIVQSIQSGLNDVVQGLLTGFEVSQVIIFPHNAVVIVSLGRPYT